MNCNYVENLITESFERKLSNTEKQCILNHIKNCKNCNEYYEEVVLLHNAKVNNNAIKDLVCDNNFNGKIMSQISCFSNDAKDLIEPVIKTLSFIIVMSVKILI